MRYLASLTFVFLCVMLSAGTATADSSVLSVTADQTSYGVRIRIEGSEPLEYDDFQLAAPRRLIVDIRNADVSRAGTGEVYEDAITRADGINGFMVTEYDLETGKIGRLEFLLSEPFSTSSYGEGNLVIIEMSRTAGSLPDKEEETGQDISSPEAENEESPSKISKDYAKPSWTGYSTLNISIMNFKAEGVPGGSANAYGLMLVGGVRIGEYFSFEGGVNWFPIGDASIVLPLPMMWMPSDGGIYLNIAGGVRLNLVEYSSNKAVPWVSAWSVGHAVISDFSVGGNGMTYGVGVDIKGDDGKITQLALRVHRFDGDLTIYDDYWDFEYPDQEIRAIELVIGFGKK